MKLDLIFVSILEVILGLGAIFGGYAMIEDPTGISFFQQDLRKYIIVSDFILPGLFLFFAFGVCTFLVLIALWMKYRIGWVGAMTISVTELLWIVVQIILLYKVGFIIWQVIIPAIALIMIFFLVLKTNRTIYLTNGKILLSKYHI